MSRAARHDPYRLAGEVFGGRYRLEEIAGTGSFGAVYRALDTRIERAVAVKVLKPDIEEDSADAARELFQREALTAGRLLHPHIVAVTDTGEEAGFAFLVMEWLEGRTLEDELRERTLLSPVETLSLLGPITDALQLAHDSGVIHRDIKPANIHLGKHGRTHVKVLDFGIAKVLTSTSAAAASRIAGTLAYMAPEQLNGGNIDRRTDVYALGAMLYQTLSGTLPANGAAQGHLIQQQMVEMPPPLCDIRPSISPVLARVVQRALAKHPSDRQQSARELHAEFAHALDAAPGEPEQQFFSAEAETIPLPALPTAAQPQLAPTFSRMSPAPPTAPQFEPTVVAPPEFRPPLTPTTFSSPSASTMETVVNARVAIGGVPQQTLIFGLLGAFLIFALSVGIGMLARWLGLTRTPYAYDEFVLELLTLAIRDGVFGAFLGVALSELWQPPPRLSVAPERWLGALLVHGAIGATLLLLPFVLLRTSLFALPLGLAVFGFVAGAIICAVRVAIGKFAARR
ncbi:MAG: serine/threonine protein kinase [Pyrinomonadaceae bacterium]|nr:serine/threonine protein kinase [Pyrinomonadaceae bacterium]